MLSKSHCFLERTDIRQRGPKEEDKTPCATPEADTDEY